MSERPLIGHDLISFAVLGEPSPEGSTRAFYIPKLKRTVVTHQNQDALRAWRDRVAAEAQNAVEGRPWTCDAVSAYEVDVDFVLPRPPSVPAHRRLRPTVRPDLDKLIRAVNDALTGIVWADDSQITAMRVAKVYVDQCDPLIRPGAYLIIRRVSNTEART